MIIWFLQIQMMRDARGQFLGIMGDHHQCLVRLTTEGFNHIPHQLPVAIVKPMQRFIENQQFRILDKSTRKQAQSLFSTAQFQKGLVGQMNDTKNIHPVHAHLSV